MPRFTPFVTTGVRRLFRLPSRSDARVAHDVEEEIAFHLDERTRELVATGMTESAARERARREFGDIAAATQAMSAGDVRYEHRHRLRDAMLEVGQDLRFAVRSLRRTPLFALIAAGTLAIGIGASTAIFGIVDGVLLKPLPYDDASRIVTLWQRSRADGEDRKSVV